MPRAHDQYTQEIKPKSAPDSAGTRHGARQGPPQGAYVYTRAEGGGGSRYWQMKLEGPEGNTVRGDAPYRTIDFGDSSPVALPPRET